MKVTVVLIAAICGVFAEPPSPLSTQYGVPGVRTGLPLSSTYGAPGLSRRLGAARSISTSYGAPSGNRGFASSRRSFSRMTPSSVYGVPSANIGFGSSNGLATQYGAPSAYSGQISTQYGVPNGGYNYGRRGAQEDPLAEPANYEFNYAVEDAESGSDFGHVERRQDENAQGQYRVLLPDGRLQIVDYEADQEGFKPSIRYEETGLGAQGYARGPASARGYNSVANAGGPY